MRYRTRKNKLHKYTAFVPKTVKATRAFGSAIINKMNYFLQKTSKTIKNTTKNIDKKTAKSIRYLSRRHYRK